MKKTLILGSFFMISLFMYSCGDHKNQSSSNDTDSTKTTTEKMDVALVAATEGKVQHITTEQFVKYVNDFKKSPTFALKSELPCVIDFYTDWCKPCKMISPFLDELAIEYKGKVHFLKINVDEEPEIADFYKIQAIPMMMFCPKNGTMKTEVGGADKATIAQRVKDYVIQ